MKTTQNKSVVLHRGLVWLNLTVFVLMSSGCITLPPELPRQCIGGNCDWVYNGAMVKTSETIKKAQGQGSMKWSDGRQYKGLWRLGQMEGQGEFSWPDGRTYQGTMANSFMHGLGTLAWGDGRKYTGQFRFNEMVGPGTLLRVDGTTRTFVEDSTGSRTNTVITWPQTVADAIEISVALKELVNKEEVWELIERQDNNERRLTITLRPNGFNFVNEVDRDYHPDVSHISKQAGVFVRTINGDYRSGRVLGAQRLEDIKYVADLSRVKSYLGTKQYQKELSGSILDVRTYSELLRATTYSIQGQRVGSFRSAGTPAKIIEVDGGIAPREIVGKPPAGFDDAIKHILHVVKSVDPDA